MTSRTADGKHTARFIILVKEGDGVYSRSSVIEESFPTRDAAQSAITARGLLGVEYKIRQK